MYASAESTATTTRMLEVEARAEARRALQAAYNWRDDLAPETAVQAAPNPSATAAPRAGRSTIRTTSA
jgi:hypothetical protein